MNKGRFLSSLVSLILVTALLFQSNLTGFASPVALPAALDDSGPGFTIREDQALVTGNILANDSDPDGDPLFVQSFDIINTQGTVSLLNPLLSGSLDASFDTDGKAAADFGNHSFGKAVAVQSDGKIVVSGSVAADFGIARFNADGSLDTSFDGDGKAITDFGVVNFCQIDEGVAVAIQPDGKIVVGGTTAYDGDLGTGEFAVARYNTNGSLDTSFNGDGKVNADFRYPVNDEARGNDLALQPDGKIVMVGYVQSHSSRSDDIAIARFKSDGSLDDTFTQPARPGRLVLDFGGYEDAYAVSIQPDGKIVIAFSGFRVLRLNPNGSIDTSFDGDGIANAGFDSSNGTAMAIQPDGKILVAGDYHQNAFALARFWPDGSLDLNFGNAGTVISSLPSDSVWGVGMALQPDGRIIVRGRAGSTTVLARYDPNGNLDTSFGNVGMMTIDFAASYFSKGITLQPDGKIVLAGNSISSDGNRFCLAAARYNNGSGTFLYDPNHQFDWLAPGERAFDSLTYVVSDGELTDTATVTITVQGIGQIFLPVTLR